MIKEFVTLSEERKVTLTCYLEETKGEFGAVDQRPAVLILPGGGYHFCSDREADPVAFPYLRAGYHAFILRYSLNDQAVWPRPLEDYEEAMSLIRANADIWHVVPDRIAVIGFSAGGHLAACAATMSRNRPNAAILGYAVIDGPCAKDYLASAPDVPSRVDGDTCPCFVFATRTDNLVPVENSVHLIDALCRNDIAFESHIYSNGGHGLTTGEEGLNYGAFSGRYPKWVEDSISWLGDMLGGVSPSAGLTPPRFGPKVNGDRDDTLGFECTFKHLAAFPEAMEAIHELLPGIEDSVPSAAVHVIRLCDRLWDYKGDPEKLKELEEKLRSIPNRL